MSGTMHDDELLDVLAASLGPPADAEPSWAEISQLHRVIDSAAYGWSGRSRSPSWRFRRPLTAAMAGFLVLGGASAAAAVSGAVMPEPVRVAARAVGLPVESPALADARAALARLRDALAANPRDLGAVRARAQDVRDRLARLSADDRARVEGEAQFLLADADAALAPPPVPLGSAPPASTSTPAATPAAAPATPEAAPAADDHGGRSAEPEHSGTSGSGDNPAVEDHSGSSGPGPSGSGSGDDHTATTQQIDNSGHGSSDGGGSGSDGGSSSDGGGSHDGGGSGSDGGGGHSGPG